MIYRFTVEPEDAGGRVDSFLAAQLEDRSRSFLQRLIREGRVHVGEQVVRANYRLREDDEIVIELPADEEPDIAAEDIPLDDAGVYGMISEGETDGVFQLESGGMRSFLSSMKPESSSASVSSSQ